MSRHEDPRETHDSSKSDLSFDELAEQELEHSTIEPKIDESKPQETPKQEPSVSKGNSLTKPTPGSSVLQESHLESADLEPKSHDLGACPNAKRKRSIKIYDDPTIYQNFPQSIGERESQSCEFGISNYIPNNSHNTESTSPVFCQSSTGVSPPNRQEGAVGGGAVEIHPLALSLPRNVLEHLGCLSDSEDSLLRLAVNFSKWYTLKMEKVIAAVLDKRVEDEEKMFAGQSFSELLSSSKCPEPERSFSVGMQRRECSETETSILEEGRKSYGKAGQVKRLQQSTISSGDSFASEEARSSPLRERDPPMETKDPIPEKMEIRPENCGGNRLLKLSILRLERLQRL